MNEFNDITPEVTPISENGPASEAADAALDLKAAKSGFSRLGLGAFVILAVGSVLQIALGGVFGFFAPQALEQPWALWVVTFVPLYCIAVPIGLLIMRKAPAYPREGERFGAGRFLKLIPICVFMMYAGNLVGALVNAIFSAILGGETANPLEPYAMGESSVWVKILFLAILAPLIEEFIFRRVLIDRMRVYGERLAVVTSALMFGLFHGNLSQFFYAFALGLLFGYVYVKTGKLRYSVILHMVINFIGSILAPALLESAGMDRLAELDPASLMSDPDALASFVTPGLVGFMVYVLLLIVLAIAGLVLLCANAKRVSFAPAERELPREKRFNTVWVNVGMILLVAACLIMIIVALLSPVLSI